jgi:hypothetical protein
MAYVLAMHAVDAASAVTRLLDMGVEDYLITSTVNGLVPRPSAENSTISARHACFCGALRSF